MKRKLVDPQSGTNGEPKKRKLKNIANVSHFFPINGIENTELTEKLQHKTSDTQYLIKCLDYQSFCVLELERNKTFIENFFNMRENSIQMFLSFYPPTENALYQSSHALFKDIPIINTERFSDYLCDIQKFLKAKQSDVEAYQTVLLETKQNPSSEELAIKLQEKEELILDDFGDLLKRYIDPLRYASSDLVSKLRQQNIVPTDLMSDRKKLATSQKNWKYQCASINDLKQFQQEKCEKLQKELTDILEKIKYAQELEAKFKKNKIFTEEELDFYTREIQGSLEEGTIPILDDDVESFKHHNIYSVEELSSRKINSITSYITLQKIEFNKMNLMFRQHKTRLEDYQKIIVKYESYIAPLRNFEAILEQLNNRDNSYETLLNRKEQLTQEITKFNQEHLGEMKRLTEVTLNDIKELPQENFQTCKSFKEKLLVTMEIYETKLLELGKKTEEKNSNLSEQDKTASLSF